MMNDHSVSITGVVLAGGQARRMGGADKGLLDFRGRPLAAYALDALRRVADPVLISANRNLDRYAQFGCPVIRDARPDFGGPLAGLLSAMKVAKTPLLITVPCDSPMMTGELLERLLGELFRQGGDIAAAHDGERMHPMFLVAKRELMPDLENYLAGGERKVGLWLDRHRLALADYRDRPDLFVNVNTPADLIELESRWAAAMHADGVAGKPRGS